MLAEKRVSDKSRSRRANFFIVGCLALLAAAEARGQSYQGGLRGALHDSGGNVMASVTLTLTNEATNLTRTTVTQRRGRIRLREGRPGALPDRSGVRTGSRSSSGSGSSSRRSSSCCSTWLMEVGNVAETVRHQRRGAVDRIGQRLGRTGDHQAVPERSAQLGAQPVLARRHLAELRPGRQSDLQSPAGPERLVADLARRRAGARQQLPARRRAHRRHRQPRRDHPDLRGDPGAEDAGQQLRRRGRAHRRRRLQRRPHVRAPISCTAASSASCGRTRFRPTTSSTTATASNGPTPITGSTAARSAARSTFRRSTTARTRPSSGWRWKATGCRAS